MLVWLLVLAAGAILIATVLRAQRRRAPPRAPGAAALPVDGDPGLGYDGEADGGEGGGGDGGD